MSAWTAERIIAQAAKAEPPEWEVHGNTSTLLKAGSDEYHQLQYHVLEVVAALAAERALSEQLADALRQLASNWCSGWLDYDVTCGKCPGCNARFALKAFERRAAEGTQPA